MKLVNYIYNSKDELTLWLNSHKVSDSILIQIFSGSLDMKIIAGVIKIILQELPQSTGCGTNLQIQKFYYFCVL